MKTRGYLKTFIPVAIVLFFALQKGSGFGFLLLLLIFIVTTPYRLVRMIRRPEERRRQLTRIGIWAAALTLAGGVHAYWSAASRNNADIVADELLGHKARTGSYPPTLAEIGIDELELNAKWKISYLVRDGHGKLSYPSSFMPLTSYEYDFEARKWVVNAY